MTLTPTLQPVRGVKGKAAPRNPVCAVPGCGEESAHGHHIYPRSHLRGEPYEWVRLPDGAVVGNTVGLCYRHHDMVTGGPGGHRARLEWKGGRLMWCLIDQPDLGYEHAVPLDPQPLIDWLEGREGKAASPSDPSHETLKPGETCANCGYTKPVPREPGPKRRALSWGVAVPADAELGAEVLDGWVEQFAAVLGLEGTKGLVRYHVLAVVLAWADQNMPTFIHDVKEAGEA